MNGSLRDRSHRGCSGRCGRHGRSGEAGQSLVETALILPVFFLIVFALIDGGRLVYSNSAVSQAAREGARVAAAEVAWIGVPVSADPSCVSSLSGVGASNPGAHVCPPSVASFKSDVIAAVNRMDVTMGKITDVYVDCQPDGGTPPTGDWEGNGCAASDGVTAIAGKGWLVSVRVKYDYRSITPIVSAVGGFEKVTLVGAATMVVD